MCKFSMLAGVAGHQDSNSSITSARLLNEETTTRSDSGSYSPPVTRVGGLWEGCGRRIVTWAEWLDFVSMSMTLDVPGRTTKRENNTTP